VTSVVTVFVTAFDFSLEVQPGSMTVFQGGSSTSTVTASGLNGLSGFVNLRALLLPPALGISVSLGSGILFVQNNQTVSTSLTVSASPTATIGNYTIVLVGSFNTPSGTPVGHALNVTLTIVAKPDFQLIANPPSISILQGFSGISFLSATSVSSFAGTVTFTSAVSPPGPTVSIANNTIFLAGGGTMRTTLTVSAGTNVVGNFTIIVTASAGGIIHSVNIQVYVAPKPDFSLTAFPPSLTVRAGSSAPAVLALTSLNGFTGQVLVFPSVSAAGVSFSPSVPSATLSAAGFVNVTVIVSVALTTTPGNYTVMFTGNATLGAHSVSLVLTVLPPPDFTLTASRSSLLIPAGTSSSSKISIVPLNGFTESVTLSSSAPAGFASNFSPDPILGGSGSSNLTLSIPSTVPVGNYTVTVTGTGGSFTHLVAIRVTVSAAPKTTLTVGQVSWAHRVSLRRSSGVETWTMTVRNTGQTPAYFQIGAAGNSTNSAMFFGVKTPVNILAPGASMTVTLSQRFTSSSIGLKFNFAITLYYGSGIYPSGDIISPTTVLVAKGAFSVAA
jgi:hypothetical protein